MALTEKDLAAVRAEAKAGAAEALAEHNAAIAASLSGELVEAGDNSALVRDLIDGLRAAGVVPEIDHEIVGNDGPFYWTRGSVKSLPLGRRFLSRRSLPYCKTEEERQLVMLDCGIDEHGNVNAGARFGDGFAQADSPLTPRLQGESTSQAHPVVQRRFTSSFRMGQLLRHALVAPIRHPSKDVMTFMVTEFIDAVPAASPSRLVPRSAPRAISTSTTSPARLNLLRLEETLSEAHLRLAAVQIECLPWLDCVERYDRPHTLFFADPPYYETDGYGVPFPLVEYERLAAAMAAAQGRMVLTVNDHPKMREVFGAFETRVVGINYTVGGNANAKPAKELIITSR